MGDRHENRLGAAFFVFVGHGRMEAFLFVRCSQWRIGVGLHAFSSLAVGSWNSKNHCVHTV
jgi:hypothetical protein